MSGDIKETIKVYCRIRPYNFSYDNNAISGASLFALFKLLINVSDVDGRTTVDVDENATAVSFSATKDSTISVAVSGVFTDRSGNFGNSQNDV